MRADATPSESGLNRGSRKREFAVRRGVTAPIAKRLAAGPPAICHIPTRREAHKPAESRSF